jgi:SAM-dependent methyltransferase
MSGVLETGKTGFELAYGKELFDWLEEHPEQGANFDRVMRLVHGGEDIALADAYDFGAVRSVVDVGGGNGTVLATLLGRNPHLEGVVFDLPSVIGRGTPALDAHAGRWEAVGGDFFEGVPAGADAYLLSHIIHDWSEDRALTILRNCRAAMGPDGRLLIAEMVVPSGDEMHPAKMLDVLMLVVNGPGMERTEAQYAELLDRAGFRLERVIPTASPESILEAVPQPR